MKPRHEESRAANAAILLVVKPPGVHVGRPAVSFLGRMRDERMTAGLGRRGIQRSDAKRSGLRNRAAAGVTGSDGKRYSARRRVTDEDEEMDNGGAAHHLPPSPAATVNDTQLDGALLTKSSEEMDNEASATMRLRIFLRCAEDALRKAEQGAGLEYAKASEVDDEILDALDAIIQAWSELEKLHRRGRAVLSAIESSAKSLKLAAAMPRRSAFLGLRWRFFWTAFWSIWTI